MFSSAHYASRSLTVSELLNNALKLTKHGTLTVARFKYVM